jgi:hypothetical protein
MSASAQSGGGQAGGVAAALRFLAAARRDPALQERLAGLQPEAGLGPVVLLAGEAGFPLSIEDLRAAFVHDWGLRRARYLRDEATTDSAASTVAVVNRPASSI